MNAKTPFLKPDQVDRTWWIVDAKDRVLGRMATRIATILQGKHRPTYTPNADTGSKATAKTYDWYTYHPGGRKVVTYEQMLAKHPARPIELAVRRMLPKSRLGRRLFSNL